MRVTVLTYVLGGLLDIVATWHSLPAPTVTVYDSGLSDTYCFSGLLVSWPVPPVVLVERRPWHQLDVDIFTESLLASLRCRSNCWTSSLHCMTARWRPRSPTVIQQTLARTGPSPTWVYCKLLCGGCWSTWTCLACFHICSLLIVLSTLLKRPCWKCCPKFSSPLTTVTWPAWCSWICLQNSTRSITTFCSSD